MLTMNWYRHLRAAFGCSKYDSSNYNNPAHAPVTAEDGIIAVDGSTITNSNASLAFHTSMYGSGAMGGLLTPCVHQQYSSYNVGATILQIATSYTGISGVVLGNGTAVPTVNDYCLSGDLITTIDSQRLSYGRLGIGEVYATYNITNTGSEAITISEYGLITRLDNATAKRHMVARDLFDEPITIPAGEVGQITIKLKMELPNFE